MSSIDPVLLCLDTATELIHAALLADGVTRSLELPGGAQASSTLLPALGGLLTDAGLNWAALDAIAFGSGPGAFTGLRTACAVTQGLALGLSCPVIPIDTLMAVAEDARLRSPQSWAPGDALWVLQDARMAELYVGAFEWTGSAWLALGAPQLWPVDEPLRRWLPEGVLQPFHQAHPPQADEATPATAPDMRPLRLAGNALSSCEALAPLLAAGAWAVPQAQPSGAALAALAQQAWHAGLIVDAALALPRYVRDKVAQTTAERAAARAAAV
jgi:tRNA threonylcarbamoyladenosine biosynthesis protein TsaB